MIGFSGDAIACWLNNDSGLRATACAARRLVVGDPGIQLIDVPSLAEGWYATRVRKRD